MSWDWNSLGEPGCAPISAIGSRVVAQYSNGEVSLWSVEYERQLTECVLITELVISAGRQQLAPKSWTGWSFSWNGAKLTMAANGAVLELAAGITASWRTSQGDIKSFDGGFDGGIQLFGDIGLSGTSDLASAQSDWEHWVANCPQVHPKYQQMTARCWYVLGLNTLRLRSHPDRLAVVPALFGYVGVWQWDAYFIAAGLRHGLPQVALDQLHLVLDTAAADGGLPDVVHDAGVLRSSADLPPDDVVRLIQEGSPYLASGDVALTKPPLAGWAVELLTSHPVSEDEITQLRNRVIASHRWWLDLCRSQSRAAYPHPYCSGLDDNPVFDREPGIETPDLVAYLLMQDELITAWGENETSQTDRDWLRTRLAKMFDPEQNSYLPLGETGRGPKTIVSLLALLAPDADPRAIKTAVAEIASADIFGASFPIRTVAKTEPTWSAEQMWCGPVWINTNYLVALALGRHGELATANYITSATLQLLADGWPAEYYLAETGEKAPGAASWFSWSAALAIDLAIQFTQ